MIRFKCPQCNKTIKAPEEKAGSAVRCPRCRERSVVPLEESAGPGSSDFASSEMEGASRAAAAPRNEVLAFFSGMRLWEQAAVAVVATAGVLGLLMPFLAPVLSRDDNGSWATPWAVILVPVSVILLCIILHGHATGCPSCGKWWTRRKQESKFVDREVFEKNGVPFARATYRTEFDCASCGHRWSVEHTDEYKDFLQKSPKRGLR